MTANSHQVGGDHYKADLQHWDWVIEHVDNRYLEGQITKYLSRWRKAQGLKDLNKSIHYLEKLIEAAEAGDVLPRRDVKIHDAIAATHLLCEAYELSATESSIILPIISWRSVDQLHAACRAFQAFINFESEQTL